MTRIDFYILPAEEIRARLLFACRLIEKAYRLNHRVYVHTDSKEDGQRFDELLWSFRNNSFIPHALYSADEQHSADQQYQRAPIEIGTGEAPADHHDVLINLSLQTPSFYPRFERISEVVIQHPQVLKATRHNYKHYKHRGYPLNRHDMRN